MDKNRRGAGGRRRTHCSRVCKKKIYQIFENKVANKLIKISWWFFEFRNSNRFNLLRSRIAPKQTVDAGIIVLCIIRKIPPYSTSTSGIPRTHSLSFSGTKHPPPLQKCGEEIFTSSTSLNSFSSPSSPRVQPQTVPARRTHVRCPLVRTSTFREVSSILVPKLGTTFQQIHSCLAMPITTSLGSDTRGKARQMTGSQGKLSTTRAFLRLARKLLGRRRKG